jgi:hypothetical protein
MQDRVYPCEKAMRKISILHVTWSYLTYVITSQLNLDYMIRLQHINDSVMLNILKISLFLNVKRILWKTVNDLQLPTEVGRATVFD